MANCYICHKGNSRGHRVSHSNIKTKRLFKPNLHRLRVKIENELVKRVSICAKCYKKIKNDFLAGKKTKLIPISLLNQQQHKLQKLPTTK